MDTTRNKVASGATQIWGTDMFSFEDFMSYFSNTPGQESLLGEDYTDPLNDVYPVRYGEGANWDGFESLADLGPGALDNIDGYGHPGLTNQPGNMPPPQAPNNAALPMVPPTPMPTPMPSPAAPGPQQTQLPPPNLMAQQGGQRGAGRPGQGVNPNIQLLQALLGGSLGGGQGKNAIEKMMMAKQLGLA